MCELRTCAWEGDPLHHAIVNGQSGSVLAIVLVRESADLHLREGSWSQRLLQLLHHHLVGRRFGKVHASRNLRAAGPE